MDKLETALFAYLRDCKDRGLKTATIKSANQAIGQYIRFMQSSGYKEFTTPSLFAFKEYLQNNGWSLSKGIRTNFKSYISPFCNWMFRNGITNTAICKPIKLPRPEEKHYPTLPLDKVDELIYEATRLDIKQSNGKSLAKWAIKSRIENRDALLFMARTGLRSSGVVNLLKENVDFLNDTFTVYTKGNTYRGKIPPDLKEMLQKRCPHGSTGYVFKTANYTLNEYVHKGCEALGLPKDFVSHTIRHSLATGLMREGAELKEVSNLLGHKSIAITADIYVNYDTEDKARTMFKNPQMRKSIPEDERIKQMLNTINSWDLDNEPRFNYKLTKTSSGFIFKVSKK